jgi:hypothetical protein
VPILLVLSVLIAGCGGDDGESESATSTTASTTTTAPTSSSTTAPSPEAEILAAYRAFWDDYIAAGDPMDPAHARLEAHATGRQLAHLRTELTKLRAERIVIRGSIDLGARVASLEGDKAIVEDCHDASKLLKYDARTGELRDTIDTRRSLWRVEMERTPSGWKVEFSEKVTTGCEARPT